MICITAAVLTSLRWHKVAPAFDATRARAEIKRKADAGEHLTSSEQLAYSFMLTNELLKENVEKRPGFITGQETFDRPAFVVSERRQHIVEPIPGGIERRSQVSLNHQQLRRDKALAEDAAKDDPWAHRSEGMKCKTCMWYVTKFNGPILGGGKETGRCRRRSPSMNGYPVVFTDDWCGDHKLA